MKNGPELSMCDTKDYYIKKQAIILHSFDEKSDTLNELNVMMFVSIEKYN